MRTDRLAWSQVACDNLKKAGATDEIFYYRRVLGKEKYAAHVFIAQYASQEQLKQHWESLNDNIALLYQSNVDSLLERSNFYLCFFLPESLDIIEKEKIENDAYCAKKYIFVSKKELSIEEKIRKINEKIFELTYLEPQDTSETKLISMQVQNFRIYKGQKNFAFTAENSPDCPASLVMIYAPNGMGKTSICDALEWALTGRIQRLSDMEKLIGRSNMLLHNREKYKSVEEYRRNKEYALVKLVLRNRAGAQDELQRVVRRNANDLNVGTFKGTLEGREKPFQNELHWNQIIMPHDQIEKFVSAIKPSDRYNEWMICVDPNGILQEQYKRRYTEYSEEQMLSKFAEFKRCDQEQLRYLSYRNLQSRKFPQDSHRKYQDVVVEQYYHTVKRSNGAFERELNPIDLLAPQFVQPEKNNPRILKQDGAFIISGLDKNADESNMKIRKYLVNEIHVPALCKALIKDQLANVGISQATLFPEVDKVADYLKRIL